MMVCEKLDCPKTIQGVKQMPAIVSQRHCLTNCLTVNPQTLLLDPQERASYGMECSFTLVLNCYGVKLDMLLSKASPLRTSYDG